jgi:hypothetical protein
MTRPAFKTAPKVDAGLQVYTVAPKDLCSFAMVAIVRLFAKLR